MGEAKRRGTYEERKAAAMTHGLIEGKTMTHGVRTTYVSNRKLVSYINFFKPTTKEV